jgi:chlorophyll synthase
VTFYSHVMIRSPAMDAPRGRLQLSAFVELLKPITWFPPMWAFLCGAVSSGAAIFDNLWLLIAGIALTGPLVCGASQIVNDWFDREVDAINEPHRPIPSGRVPGHWGLGYAVFWSAVAMAWGLSMGQWVGVATFGGLILAWIYSAPPLRLKKNGWWGNAAVGISYEGLAWITGAAVFLQGAIPNLSICVIALLYSIGAHGIMTLNDFKSIAGDRAMGLRSLPAALGPEKAARVACVVMSLPQLAVITLLYLWGAPWHSLGVSLLLLGQAVAMVHMLKDPEALAPWYNGTGVTAYVSGMMISAFALAGVTS